jgi:hypothetical protein
MATGIHVAANHAPHGVKRGLGELSPYRQTRRNNSMKAIAKSRAPGDNEERPEDQFLPGGEA